MLTRTFVVSNTTTLSATSNKAAIEILARRVRDCIRWYDAKRQEERQVPLTQLFEQQSALVVQVVELQAGADAGGTATHVYVLGRQQ